MTAPARWQSDFIERVAAVADVSGLPPSCVQVFAWLIVCDPAEQSVEDMRASLGLSGGAISTATGTLVRMGLVERIVQPGRRRLYYRFRPGGWERMLQLRLEATAHMRAVAEEAIVRAPHPPDRLAEMREVYAWFEEKMSELFTQEQTWLGSAAHQSRQ